MTNGSAAGGIEARGVTKRFPGVLANDGVDVRVLAGEVHGLLGENGSGKTTLCKILTGLYQPDAGQVIVRGRPVEFHDPGDAYASGVFMVHQHFSLVQRLTVAENVVLGWSRSRHWRLNRGQVESEVAEAAAQFHIDVDPSAYVWQLSIGEQQRVEILKALYRGATTLILDEPTTVLTPQEADHLCASLRGMAASGASVIFISHKLHEVLAVCDRITVLRQGRAEGTVDLREDGKQIGAAELAHMMVGREVHLRRKVERAARASDGSIALSVRDLVAAGPFGPLALKGVSFELAAGEILGVAGVSGNGQRELADVIAGVRRREQGEVEVGGRRLPNGDPRDAIDAGVAYVPEDRMGVGLAPGLPISDNIALKQYRSAALSSGPFLSAKRLGERTESLLSSFNVKGRAGTLVRQLSGGNAQKVVLARELSSQPKVLIASTPTRGLDVAATDSVRTLLVDAAAEGVGVLLISEDLDELLDLADRVAVMCAGRITGILDAEDADPHRIGVLMLGEETAPA